MQIWLKLIYKMFRYVIMSDSTSILRINTYRAELLVFCQYERAET